MFKMLLASVNDLKHRNLKIIADTMMTYSMFVIEESCSHVTFKLPDEYIYRAEAATQTATTLSNSKWCNLVGVNEPPRPNHL